MRLRDFPSIPDSLRHSSNTPPSLIGLDETEPNPVKPLIIAEFIREWTDDQNDLFKLFKVNRRQGKYSYVACLVLNTKKAFCVEIWGAYRDGRVAYDKKVGCLLNSGDVLKALKLHGFKVQAY